MSLEQLKALTDGIATLRAAVDTNNALTTKEREANAKTLATLESRLAECEAAMRKGSLSLPGSEVVAKNYSIGRALRAHFTGNWKHAELELDIHAQTVKRMQSMPERMLTPEQRATLTTTPSAAGFLIPEEISTILVERPSAMAVAKELGVTIVRPNGWPFKVNKRTGGLTAYMVGENSASTASDIALGQVQLNPRKCVARTFVTAEQISYGNPQTDAIIADELNLAIELKKDDMIFNGTGASGEPLGIFNTTGINTTAAATSGKLRFTDIATALQKIETANVKAINPGVAMHSDLKWELAKDLVVQYTGQDESTYAGYVLQFPFLSPEKFKAVTGANLGQANQIATTKCMTGEYRHGWLAEFGGMVVGRSLEATDGTNNAWTQEGVHIKATVWFDFAVVLAAAFSATTGA